MKRLSAWFDRHGKLRIALQLLLDASPLLLMAWAMTAISISGDGQIQWRAWLFDVSMTVFAFLTVPLFIWSVLTARNLVEFDIYPAWGKVSLALRWLSVVPMLIAAAMDLMLIATVLDVVYYLTMWFGSK